MYNNYFPVTYPQAQPMSYPQYQQTQNTGINWVQGIEGAVYPLPLFVKGVKEND